MASERSEKVIRVAALLDENARLREERDRLIERTCVICGQSGLTRSSIRVHADCVAHTHDWPAGPAIPLPQEKHADLIIERDALRAQVAALTEAGNALISDDAIEDNRVYLVAEARWRAVVGSGEEAG